MSAAEGIESNALRLGVQRLAAILHYPRTINQSIKFYCTRKFKYWSGTAKDQLVNDSCTRSRVIKQYRRVLKFVTKIKRKSKKKKHLRILHNRTKSNEKKHIICTKSRVSDITGNYLGNKRTLTIKAKLHAYSLRAQKKENGRRKFLAGRRLISQTSRWLYRHPVTKMFMLNHEKYDVFFYANSSSLLQ